MELFRKFMPFAALLGVLFLQAQTNPGVDGPSAYEVQLVPGNPEVANLGRFGDNPMNKYNGSANINIPIHVVELDGLQIPFSLSYNTSGIRVQQEASWVGLGWNLSDGISISREINGFDDLRTAAAADNEGWLYSQDNLPPTGPGNTQFRLDKDELYALDLDYGQNDPDDLEPDLFTANTPSGMVKFQLPKIGSSGNILQARTLGERNFKIAYNVSAKTFTLTDPNGFIYYFDQHEKSTSYMSNTGSSINESQALNLVNNTAKPQSQDLILTWKVSRIESPYYDAALNDAALDFTYAEGFQIGYPNFSETYGIDVASIPQQSGTVNLPQKMTASISGMNMLYLDTISGDFGKIVFDLGPRDDAFTPTTMFNLRNMVWNIGNNPNNASTHSLASVRVLDIHDKLVKTATFNYSYFNADDSTLLDKERYLRLKLDSISILDKNYAFFYESPNALPAKDTHGKDFWGFYNGRDDNTTRIPSFNRYLLVPPSSANGNEDNEAYFKYQGADRASNFTFGKRGLLNRVEYPTGGSTEFVYEPHTITLKKNSYTRQFRTNGNFRSSGLRTSDSYNFRYQQLKLADNPSYSLENEAYVPCSVTSSSVTGSTSGTAFQVTDTDLCNNAAYFDTQGNLLNVEISANFSCVLNCDNASPSGLAVWIVNTDTGAQTNLFNYSGQFNSGNSSSITTTIGLPVGNYELFQQQWSTGSGPNTSVATVSSVAEIWTGNASSPPAVVYEEFEVGGARIFQTVNKDSDGTVLSRKQYEYEQSFDNGSMLSSGILMDDLVFWSPAGSLFEYSPDTAIAQSGASSFYLSSDNKLRTQNSASGSHIGYCRVKETQLDENGQSNGHAISTFINKPNEYLVRETAISQVNLGVGSCNITLNRYVNEEDLDCFIHYDVSYGDVYLLGKSPNTHAHANGRVLMDSIYSASNVLKRVVTNTYDEYSVGSAPYDYYPAMNWFTNGFLVPDPYELISASDHRQGMILRQSSNKVESFETSGNLETLTEYHYDHPIHFQMSRSVVHDSRNKVLTTKIYYPQNLQSEPHISDLMAQNRMMEQIRSESFIGTSSNPEQTALSTQQTNYALQSSMNNIPMPSEKLSLKGVFDAQQNPTERRLVYERYDANGNLVQYRKEDGTPVCLIWGYEKQFPIAQVENAEYANISSFVGDLATRSNNDDDRTMDVLNPSGVKTYTGKEGLLREKLDEVRNGLSEAMVTSYTYDPLIGVTSITDPSGYTIYYHYDAENRLEFIKDADGNLITEHRYNYKN
ncbi:MAG: hypothetical protein AAGD88_15955 [Bacteroidota bacterium]